MQCVVAAFYHFFDFPHFAEKRADMLAVLKAQNIKGSILIAAEGINGTVAGTRLGIDHLLTYLKSDIVGGAFEHKESFSAAQPFKRAKVRLKKELISLGEPCHPGESRDPSKRRGRLIDLFAADVARWIPAYAGMTVGEYVEPENWNTLIADPDTIIVDTRNAYEVHLGTFENAVNPGIRNFKELPAFTRKHLGSAKQKKIATFCTGGIRCEKFTAWLKAEGFEQVYHLKSGILKYLETIPPEKSKWQGECYVFDERIAVGHGLLPSATASACLNCGHALTSDDRAHPVYEKNIRCPYCA